MTEKTESANAMYHLKLVVFKERMIECRLLVYVNTVKNYTIIILQCYSIQKKSDLQRLMYNLEP